LKVGSLPTTAQRWGAFAALLFVAPMISAQRVETDLDVGAAVLRYADTLNATTFGLTPHVSADWREMTLDAAATYSQFTSGGSALQGSILFARSFRLKDDLLYEIGGFAGGSTHNDGSNTGQGLVDTKLRFAFRRADLFLGVAAGRACYGGSCSRLLIGESGVSAVRGPASGAVTFTPSMVSDSIRYADLQGMFFWSRDQLDVGVSAGHRFGDQLQEFGTDTRTWASFSATQWVRPRIGIVLGAGSYPMDLTQGFPGGRFASLSVRIRTGTFGQRLSAAETPAIATESDIAVPSVAEFRAVREGRNRVTFSTTITGAASVDITGDFTQWKPVALTRNPLRPEVWSTSVSMPPGKYQMNIRVNTGPWSVPPGLLPLTDEFGGAVGLLVIE